MFFKLNKKQKIFFKINKILFFIHEENNWKKTSRNSHQKIFWNHDLRTEYLAIPNIFFL